MDRGADWLAGGNGFVDALCRTTLLFQRNMFKPTPYNFLAALTLIAGLIGLLDITDALPTFYLESQVRYLVKRATSNLPAVQVPPASNRQTPSSQLLVTADSLKGRPTELMSTDARKSQLAALGFAEPRNVAEWGEWFQQITKEYQGFSPSANSVIGDKNFGVCFIYSS